MRMAIEAGLEIAPIGVITTPGTKNPNRTTPPAILPLKRRQAKRMPSPHALLTQINAPIATPVSN
jgi:hypothetical protein